MNVLPVVGAGLSALGGMSAAKQQDDLLYQQKKQAQQQRKLLNQYQPGLLSSLNQQYQNPQNDPWYRAQMGKAESDVHDYFGSALGALAGKYAGNGLGNSTFAANDRNAIAMNGAGQLASLRMSQLGDMQNRRSQALQQMMALLGLQGPDTSATASAYGQQSGNALQSLGQLAALFGQQQTGTTPQVPTAPTGGMGGYGAVNYPGTGSSVDYLKNYVG